MILKPIFAQLELTEACTHKCTHCYNYYAENRSPSFLDEKVLDKIIQNEFFYITLTGGEPLMNKEVLFNSIKKLKESNMDVSLNSNLYLLTKEDAKILRDFGINHILSSILGPTKEIHEKITQRKNSFANLLNSLDYLRDCSISTSLNMVVTQENLDKVYETGEFLYNNFGIKKFSATPIVPSSKNDKHLMLGRREYINTLDELLRLEKNLKINVDSLHPAIPCMFQDNERDKYKQFFEKRGCAAGKGAITFSPTGDVRVCSHEHRIYGNILKHSFEKILEGMKEWNEGSLTPQECNNCFYLKKCNGGCRVSSEIMGDIQSPDPYFLRPITKKQTDKKIKINLNNLKSVEGNIRYRFDSDEMITIYLNPNVNARLDKLEFEIFKRLVSNKTFREVSEELGDINRTQQIFSNLFNKGLLIEDRC